VRDDFQCAHGLARRTLKRLQDEPAIAHRAPLSVRRR
jgi:hypothetical protein